MHVCMACMLCQDIMKHFFVHAAFTFRPNISIAEKYKVRVEELIRSP
jgi:hypothetical protein